MGGEGAAVAGDGAVAGRRRAEGKHTREERQHARSPFVSREGPVTLPSAETVNGPFRMSGVTIIDQQSLLLQVV